MAHARIAKAAIVVKVLHGYPTGHVAKHNDAKVCAVLCGGVTQGAHFVGKIQEGIEAFDPTPGSGWRGRLTDRIHPNLLTYAIVVSEAAGNRLQISLVLGHVVVVWEGSLCCYVAQGKNTTPLTQCVHLIGRLKHLVKANGRNVPTLGQEIVVGTVVNVPKLKLVRSIDASDLLINVNFSFRDNATVIRKVVENTNMATAGQKTVSFKLDANYKLNEYLSAIFYYEQFINTPKVSLSYPTGNLKTGITLRFDLNGLK